LFASGRALSIRQLAKLTGKKSGEVANELEQLASDYKEGQSGLSLLRKDQKAQLVSDPAQGKLVESFIKEEFTGALSRAALETLAIISYRGPIPKPEIDMIRGVNSAIMLRTLLVRGLVERKRSTKDARTYVYSLTFDFMRHLGVNKIEDLPKYEELRHNKVIEKFAQAESDGKIKGQSDNS